jgi:hypothetical protein
LRRGMGGGPVGVVLVEPLADAAVHADVEAGALGFEPLVLEDFIKLVQDAEPEGFVGKRFRDFQLQRRRLGAGVLESLLVLDQGGDGKLEEFDDFGGEVDLSGRAAGVGGGEGERAADKDVPAGEQGQVLAAGNAEAVSPGVDLAKQSLGQGNADCGLAVSARFPQNGASIIDQEPGSTG